MDTPPNLAGASRREWRLRIAIAIVVLTGVVAAWVWHRAAGRDSGELVLYGNVDIRQVSLAFNASERIVALRAQEGDRVRAGEVLGQLDQRTSRRPKPRPTWPVCRWHG